MTEIDDLRRLHRRPVLRAFYDFLAGHRMTAPPPLTPAKRADIALHPCWTPGMLRTRRRSFGRIIGHVPGVDSTGGLMDRTSRRFHRRPERVGVAPVFRKSGGPVIPNGTDDIDGSGPDCPWSDDPRTAADGGLR